MGAIVASGSYDPDCDRCEKWSPEQRKFKGCDGPAQIPLFEFEGEKFFECPKKATPTWVWEFFACFAFCKNFQVLPVAGGYLDQSSMFVQACIITEDLLNKLSKDKKE